MLIESEGQTRFVQVSFDQKLAILPARLKNVKRAGPRVRLFYIGHQQVCLNDSLADTKARSDQYDSTEYLSVREAQVCPQKQRPDPHG